ncbi:MAG: murein biosynthesis integral membrane protein MurJ, partial [Alphaproteobacteria bacterium]
MSLLKSSMIVSIWTMASRMLGFARDMLMANKMGASAATDAFFIALILPNLLRRLFAEGAFNIAFVPLYSRLNESDPKAAQAFVNQAFTWMIVFLGMLTIVAEIIMPAFVMLLAAGYANNVEKFALTVLFARCTFPYLVLISLASLLGALCNSAGKFAAYAFVPTLLNVALIGALIVAEPFGWEPALASCIAVPIGGVLQLGFMLWAFKRAGLKVALVRPELSRNMRHLFVRFWPAALGVGVLQISFIIDTTLASWLEGPAVSYLQYANRFYQLPLAIIGTALATVLLPHMARALERQDQKAADGALTQSLGGGIAIALAATAGLAMLAHELMATLLHHGKFTAEATNATAWAMIAYSLGLPGYILTKITATGFYAAGDTKTPVKAAAYALLVNFVGNLILMQYFGHVGIALATALSGWTNAGLQWYWLQRTGQFTVKGADLVWPLAKAALVAGVVAASLWGFAAVVPFAEHSLLQFAWLAAATVLGGVVFAGGSVWSGLI